MNRDRLEQTVCTTVAGCGRLAVVVLKPIIQSLRFSSRIVPMVYSPIAGRHDIQTCELFIIVCSREVPAPVRMRLIERFIPELADVSAVLCRQRRISSACSPTWITLIIEFITGSFPCDRIHIAAVLDNHNRGTVRRNRFCRGTQEREVRGIQFARSGAVRAGGGGIKRHRTAGGRSLGHSRKIGESVIVRILDHVNDLVFALRRRPLRNEGFILLQRERIVCSLCACRIRIPTCEGIACARCGRGQGDLRAVRSRLRVDIFTAADVVGQREVSAGIVYLQFLIRVARDDNVCVTGFIVCIRVALGVRRHDGVLDADFVFGLDQRIAVTVEVLQIVTDFIIRIRFDIFVFHGEPVYIFVFIKHPSAIKRHRDGRIFRIVGRLVRDFRCGRETGGCYRVTWILELALGDIVYLRADVDPSALLIQIVVVDRQLIAHDRIEDGNRIETLRYGVADINDIMRRLVLPMIKDLALDELIVRQSCDVIAYRQIDKVLRFFPNDIAVIVLDKESDGNLFGKKRIQRQVLIDRGGSGILRALTARLGEPAAEGKARLDRVGREDDRRSGSGGHLFIDRIVHHERDGEDVLYIVSFNREILRNHRTDRELIGRSRIDPLADLVRLRRDFRQIVDRKTFVDGRLSGLFRAVFLYEGDRVDDLLLRNDRGERFRHNGFRGDFFAVADPLGIVTGYFRHRGKLIADGMPFDNLDRDIGKCAVVLSVRIERDCQDLGKLRLDRHVGRDERFRGHFFAAGNPLVENAAFGSFGIRGKRADRLTVGDESRLDGCVAVHERDGPGRADLIREDVLRARREVDAVLARLVDMVVARGIPVAAVGDLELIARGEVYRRNHVFARGGRIVVQLIARVVGRPSVYGTSEVISDPFRLRIKRFHVEIRVPFFAGLITLLGICRILGLDRILRLSGFILCKAADDERRERRRTEAAAARRCAGQPGITVAGLAIDGKRIALERAARKVKMYRTACRSDCSAFRIGERDADSNRVNSGLSDRVLCHCQR